VHNSPWHVFFSRSVRHKLPLQDGSVLTVRVRTRYEFPLQSAAHGPQTDQLLTQLLTQATAQQDLLCRSVGQGSPLQEAWVVIVRVRVWNPLTEISQSALHCPQLDQLLTAQFTGQHTPVLQLRVSLRVLGQAVPLQGFCVIRIVRVCVERPQPLHGLHAFQLHVQLTGLTGQHYVLQILVSPKMTLQLPPHMAGTAILLLRTCVPEPQDFVQALHGAQFSGLQFR